MTRVKPQNPFDARYLSPGALPFNPTWSGWSADAWESWQAQWQRDHRRGAIVGPHGAGKSTWLAAWGVRLEQAGFSVRRITITAATKLGQRIPPRRLDAQTVVLLDGYEQLGLLNRLKWWLTTRRTGCGLIVSSHRATAYPTLVDLRPSYVHFVTIARQCCEQSAAPSPCDQVLRQVWHTVRGNLREGLFRLYDWYELEARDQHRVAWESNPA